MTDPELSHLPDPPPEVEVAVLYAGRTPRERAVRTFLQVLVGVLVVVPAALGVISAAGVNVPGRLAALVAGVTGAAVMLISAGQNAYDEAKGRG